GNFTHRQFPTSRSSSLLRCGLKGWFMNAIRASKERLLSCWSNPAPAQSYRGNELFSQRHSGNVRTGTQSTHSGNSGLSQKNADQPEGGGSHDRGGGNGDQPRPHNSRGHAPAHRRQPVDRTDAHNGAGNGVGCADRNSGQGGREQSDGPGALGAKTVNRFQFRDPLPHGVHDAPAAEIGASGDGGMSGKDDGPMQASPVAEHVLLAHESGGVKSPGDDAHGLL